MEPWDAKRNALGQFGPGNSGRPLGARNRINRKLHGMCADSAETNLAAVLEEVRHLDPKAWLRIILKAIPAPTNQEDPADEQLTPEQVDQRLRDYAARLVAAGYGPAPGEALPAPATGLDLSGDDARSGEPRLPDGDAA